MTAELDLNAIRAALAAATPFDNGEERPTNEYRLARSFVNRYAPVWLAQCLTEIERLRAQLDNYDEERRIQREKDDR